MVRCSRQLDRRRTPALGDHRGLGSCRRLMVAVADWPSDRPVARSFRMQQGRRYCREIGASWLFWRGRMGEGDCREGYSPRACFYPRGIGGCHLPHGSRIRRSLRGRRRRILPQTHNPSRTPSADRHSIVSHRHPDHFDIPSLARVQRECDAICPADPLIVYAGYRPFRADSAPVCTGFPS
jgi:hypothetical protein